MNEKVEYLENHSRQNNIQIYQVKEGAEGDDAVGFIGSLLISLRTSQARYRRKEAGTPQQENS